MYQLSAEKLVILFGNGPGQSLIVKTYPVEKSANLTASFKHPKIPLMNTHIQKKN